MSRLKLGFFAFMGYWFLRTVFFLNRQTVLYKDIWEEVLSSGRPVLICCWHGRLLFPVFRWFNKGSHALAGLHQDGEIISRIAEKLGWKMLRGSSSRGGVRAYIELLKTLNNSGRIFITPDGPKGPQFQLKEGIVKSAIRSDAIILPVSGQASSRWEVRNWDNFVVPKPFGKVVLVIGGMIDVRDYHTINEFRLAVKNEMNKTQAEADVWINQ